MKGSSMLPGRLNLLAKPSSLLFLKNTLKGEDDRHSRL
jgi:hypothetical protein